jgi:uncharacterized membrane protein
MFFKTKDKERKMKYKTIKMIEGIVCITLPIVLALTIIFKIWYLPLAMIFLSMVLFGILISRTKDILEDEGTILIDAKAGNSALLIGSIVMILGGSILMAISSDNTPWMETTAITLFATSFGLTIINYFTKLFYNRKLGGK